MRLFSPSLSHVGQFLPTDHCALLFHFLTVRLRVDRFSVTFWFETDSRRPELCSALFVWLTLNMQWQKDTDIWTQSVFSKLWSFEIWWSSYLAGSHFRFNYCHYLLNRVMFYYFKNSAVRFWYGKTTDPNWFCSVLADKNNSSRQAIWKGLCSWIEASGVCSQDKQSHRIDTGKKLEEAQMHKAIDLLHTKVKVR